MTRPALCIGGPLDGKVFTGPETLRLETSALRSASMFDDDPTDQQGIKIVVYLKATFVSDDEEFDFYIPDGMSKTDAFRTLVNGYKPKENR